MHTAIVRSVSIGLALSAFVFANAAVAETITYKSVINAQNVTPANDSKGTGSAVVTFDPATKTLTWDINFDGLISTAPQRPAQTPPSPS
jgi:hypothetical protein